METFKVVFIFLLCFTTTFLLIGFNQKRRYFKSLKNFRDNLKVGDETSDGVVIAINGYHVITEKTTRIENIYPYSEF